MIKLYKARSLLYRRQILQENIRWKALDEIYKMYMLSTAQASIFQQKFADFFLELLENLAFFSRGAIETSEKTKRKINRNNRTEGFRSNP